MSNYELIFSFIVGVASGIVSSILVTVYYRKKDSEKDRQSYFMNIRVYMNQLLAIEVSDIDAIGSYLCTYEMPKMFKWIRLRKDEKKVVLKAHELISNLQDLLFVYEKEKLKLQYDDTYQEKIDILSQKYLPDMISLHVDITYYVYSELQLLGNETLKKYVKKHKESRI